MKARINLFLCILAVCAIAYTGYSFLSGDRVIDIVAACPPKPNFECIASTLSDIARAEGLKTAFLSMRLLYEKHPEFRPQCYSVMLEVGRRSGDSGAISYDSRTYTPESVWCNYGFYQGYPERLVVRDGSREARQFCEFIAGSLGKTVRDVRTECFRGVGRGAVLVAEGGSSVERKSESAVSICRDATSGKEDFESCAGGVFNQLGRAAVAGAYGLAVNDSDPYALCRTQPDDLIQVCMGNFKWPAVNSIPQDADLPERYAAITRLFGTGTFEANAMTWTDGYQRAQRGLDKPETPALSIQESASLPTESRIQYLSGFAYGLSHHGFPGKQHEQVIEYCKAASAAFPELRLTDCLFAAISYLQGLYTPHAFQAACKKYPSELSDYCG